MQKKEGYFSHDVGARNNEDVAPLILEHKDRGYGIFWATVEMMHHKGGWIDFNEKSFIAIAKDLHSEVIYVQLVITHCVEKYKLFFVGTEDNAGMISSNRVLRNITEFKDSVQQRIDAGKAGAAKRRAIAEAKLKEEIESSSAERPLSDRSALDERNPANININTNRNINRNISLDKGAKKQKQKNPIKNPAADQLSPGAALNGVVCYDAQEMILKDQKFFEEQCMKANITADVGKIELEKYHLHQSKTEQYPMGRKPAMDGFRLWLIRSKEFAKTSNNGNITGRSNAKVSGRHEPDGSGGY